MDDLYTVPNGVRLDADDVRQALAVEGVAKTSYVANGVLNHVFRGQRTGATLFVVESDQSKRLTEVVGDVGLWLTVRAVAIDVFAAGVLRGHVPPRTAGSNSLSPEYRPPGASRLPTRPATQKGNTDGSYQQDRH